MAFQTVRAKLLLGWMNQHDAVDALNACEFDPPLTKKKAIQLWKDYRDKVAALKPRDPQAAAPQPLTDNERIEVEEHLNRINSGENAKYHPEVLKIDPHDLV